MTSAGLIGKLWISEGIAMAPGWLGGAFAIEWMIELISTELYADRRLSSCAQSLYQASRFQPALSLTALSKKTGYSLSSVSRACAELVSCGWAKASPVGREKHLFLTAPEIVQLKQAALFEKVYWMQPLKGEFLTKVLLDALITSRTFLDNARPKWLVNPLTGEQLEFDRVYFSLAHGLEPENIDSATFEPKDCPIYPFEYHGPQHYRTTLRYPDPDELRRTQARDLIKKGRCADLGVTLVVVNYRDLSPRAMAKRVPKGLPRGRPDLDGKYMEKVAEFCSEYRANSADVR